MSKYKAILTTAGAAKIAAASAGGKPLKIDRLAVGDGNGTLPTPSPAQTKLINERYRAALNSLTVDKAAPDRLIAELIIPASVGGFWLREMGLYDADGVLIAVSNMAESYKPKLEEGSGRTQTLRMVLIVSHTEAITLIISGDMVTATRDFVAAAIDDHAKSRNHPDATTAAKGFVQLSSAVDSEVENLAATPKAIKSVNDAAVKRAQNLADLTDKALSRKNLELGSAAVRNTGIGSSEIALNGSFGIGGATPEVARDNTLSVIKGMGSGNYAVNAPSPDMPSTAVSYQLDWSLTSASGNRYGVLIARALSDKGQVNDKHWRNSLRNGVWQGWVMFYDSENKPTAADVNAYAKSESDSRYAYKSITINGKPLSSNVNLTAGDLNAWNKTESDGRFIYKTGDTINWLNVNNTLNIGLDTAVGRTLFVNGQEFIYKRGLQDPVNNARQTNGMRIQGAGNLLVDIYHHERIGQYHHFGIHLSGGGADGWYEFRGDGSFSAGATVGAGGPNGAKLYQDGNLSGSQWGGYLSNWLSNNTVSRVMRGSQGSMTMDGRLVEAPAGCVLTGGNGNEGNQVGVALYRPLQIWRGGSWVTIEG
ncbi:phage tail protein [Serratia sp. T13T92]|uniref:phage tail protein n=1 Tax=Serratia sp. T13T92 TaxID=3397496 RepID=UPI0039DFD539